LWHSSRRLPDIGRPRSAATRQRVRRPDPGRPRAAHRVGRPWHLLVPLAGVLALALFWRIWQQLYAFDKGLDATMPGFAEYWLTLFAFNILVLPLFAAGWYGWILLTGPRAASEKLTPTVETQRIWRLWLILAGFTFAAYFGGSYFAEQDAAWHQVTMRDTAFTPSHVALFYGAFPLMIWLSFGAFLYARTRLPHLYGSGKLFPVSFALVVGGSMLLVFQVAFNEFGHTFWETEEIFSAPLHWPFVFFAYLLIATFAVWFRSALRLLELVRAEAISDGRTAEVSK